MPVLGISSLEEAIPPLFTCDSRTPVGKHGAGKDDPSGQGGQTDTVTRITMPGGTCDKNNNTSVTKPQKHLDGLSASKPQANSRKLHPLAMQTPHLAQSPGTTSSDTHTHVEAPTFSDTSAGI